MKKKGLRHIIFMAFVFCLPASTMPSFAFQNVKEGVTPSTILAKMKFDNAEHVLDQLVHSRDWHANVLPGIQSARSDWLDVALKLHSIADAGAAEDLDDALFNALLQAPYKVLPKFRRFWWKSTEVACTFGYDSEFKGGVDHYAKKLRAALGNTAPTNFTLLRVECLKGIDATLIEIERYKNK